MFGATRAIFLDGARPKAPAARRGPQGAENRQKNGAGSIILSFLRSAQPDPRFHAALKESRAVTGEPTLGGKNKTRRSLQEEERQAASL